jgi:hypothetical protein
MTGSGIKQGMTRTALEVGAKLDSVFDELEQLGPQAQRLLNGGQDHPPTRADLRALKQPLLDIVRRSHGLVDGTGIAIQPGTLADVEMWLEWWRISDDNAARFAGHSFDQKAIGFYDYTEMNWFRVPNESNEPSAVGPYLDNGGTNLRIVTLSMPVDVAAGRRAVIAADLSLAVLEMLILREIGPNHPVALVTQTGKVVASNSSRLTGGSLLSWEMLDRSPLQVAIPSQEPLRLAWRLVAI